MMPQRFDYRSSPVGATAFIRDRTEITVENNLPGQLDSDGTSH